MSRVVKVGDVLIGGDNPVSIQTMTDVNSANGVLLLSEVERLHSKGADIVRATVNDDKAAEGFAYAAKRSECPLVADIHFDHRLAIKAALGGAAKIRINPGNIGSYNGIDELVKVCKDKKIPIRIGVNKGSLDKDIVSEYGRTYQALVESALKHARLLETRGFYDIVISVKSSDVTETVKAYRALSRKCDYPLHLGVTEAGGGDLALVKSSIGIGSLLLDGIGDTIRVSLTEDPVKEIYAARNILRSLKIDENFVEIISCPTCGRTEYDVKGISERLREKTAHIRKKITISVLGCVVNGIGEGKDADIGVAGGKDKCVIFEKGKVLTTVSNDEVEEALDRLIAKYTNNG